MVGPKYLNESRGVAIPLSGVVCHPWATVGCHPLPTYLKYVKSTSSRYELTTT